MCHDWPKSPLWPEDLTLIRELLADEEYAELLRRMVQVLPNGPLLDYPHAFAERELKAPTPSFLPCPKMSRVRPRKVLSGFVEGRWLLCLAGGRDHPLDGLAHR